MAITVKWADIVAECGNYRDAFVAIFRKYEGMPTDEKDGQGRVVKVTAQSFALHNGIEPVTFRRWSRNDTPSGLPRSESRLGHDVKRAAVASPDAVVTGIMRAPEEAQDAILRDLERKVADRRLPFGGAKPDAPDRHVPVDPATELTTHCVRLRDGVRALGARLRRLDEIPPALGASLAALLADVSEEIAPHVSADGIEDALAEWMKS